MTTTTKNYNYVASVMAGYPDRDDPTLMLIHHAPMLLEANTVDDAMGVAREGALATFPIERGWQDHHAVVCPIADLSPGSVVTTDFGDEVVSSVVWDAPPKEWGAPAVSSENGDTTTDEGDDSGAAENPG
jgi:hypothetical protein